MDNSTHKPYTPRLGIIRQRLSPNISLKFSTAKTLWFSSYLIYLLIIITTSTYPHLTNYGGNGTLKHSTLATVLSSLTLGCPNTYILCSPSYSPPTLIINLVFCVAPEPIPASSM